MQQQCFAATGLSLNPRDPPRKAGLAQAAGDRYVAAVFDRFLPRLERSAL